MLEKQIALIPALEPDHHLLEILRPLKSTGWDIVVVDDGSGTHYQHVFRQAGRFATVLHHKTNRGKGAALKTGLHYIQRKYAGAVVVTLDADGQHTVHDAETVCNTAMKNPGCLVLGCRRPVSYTHLKLLSAAVLAGILALLLIGAQRSIRMVHRVENPPLPVIVIDPGHGSSDGGTTGIKMCIRDSCRGMHPAAGHAHCRGSLPCGDY